MVAQKFHKFLDNEINISQFEEWIYKNVDLENIIGEDNYQMILEFNYKKKSAEIEIKNYILNNLTSERKFADWKVNKLLELNKIEFPNENLFSYAKQNPNFLKDKELRFNQYWTKKKIEIFWTDNISQFVRHTSEIDKDNEKYLYLGTYEDSYIHLVVNRKNEIWVSYDIIDKEDFLASNMKEAIGKLFIQK